MKKLVIFDLDDTLLDYSGARKRAYSEIDRKLLSEGINTKSYWKFYKETEPYLMRKFLDMKIGLEEYRSRRFSRPLKMCGIINNTLSDEINRIFMYEGNENISMFDEVKEVLVELENKNINKALLTNGPGSGQKKKIKSSGIGAFFDDENIFISEETGIAKPNSKAFLNVVNRFNIAPNEALMIGDSLKYDYNPSKELGMESILIDRNSLHSCSEISAVSSLHEVLNLL